MDIKAKIEEIVKKLPAKFQIKLSAKMRNSITNLF